MKKLIYVMLIGGVFAITNALADEYVIGQKDKTFVMDGTKVESISVKAGDTVKFLNEDPFFHNIFSLSELKTFDLGSFPKGDSRSVTFNQLGTIEIECAIHPDMYLELEVK
jgi:plastocyanin